MTKKIKSQQRPLFSTVRTCMLTGAALLTLSYANPSEAACLANGWWPSASFSPPQIIYLTETYWKNFIIKQFFEDRLRDDLWKKNILPALHRMSEQLVSARVYQTGMIGNMMDAKHLAETQLVLQEMQARAAKDYTPGENLCRFGTLTRSLAASQENSTNNLVALSEISENRQLSTRGGSAEKSGQDSESRVDQLRRVYCDPGDNNGQMGDLCAVGTATAAQPAARTNKDIDIARTLEAPLTLNADFTDSTMTSDEEDLIALSNNLYGSETMGHLPSAALTSGTEDPNKPSYLDVRQVVALRSVAQNSFIAQTALRARGAAGSAEFLRNVLVEMGMSTDEARRYVSYGTSDSAGEPSYYAQMEILTKKLYQNPNFYVNLIDKPANVKRQIAAMQAFGLMQNRDLFESLQRQEVLMSLLLELEVRNEQRRLQPDWDGLASSPN